MFDWEKMQYAISDYLERQGLYGDEAAAASSAFRAGWEKALEHFVWHKRQVNPDDLPEENKNVIVYFEYGYSQFEIAIARRIHNAWDFLNPQPRNASVIAWCEIPKFDDVVEEKAE